MASKLLDNLLDEMEVQRKDPNYVKLITTCSDEWYFGQMIGNIIVDRYLLNTNVDMLYKNTISVSTNEFNKAHELEILNHKGVFNESNHKVWLDYVDSLAIKYLPETITCSFNLPAFTVTKDIQKGIENYIWNCDFSRYWIDNLFGQTINKNNPIILKLQIR